MTRSVGRTIRRDFFPSAVKQLELATSGANPKPVRLYHLAMAYQKTGNSAKAKQTFERAAKLAPAIPEAETGQKK